MKLRDYVIGLVAGLVAGTIAGTYSTSKNYEEAIKSGVFDKPRDSRFIYSRPICVGDLNRDGLADFAITNENGELFVILGKKADKMDEEQDKKLRKPKDKGLAEKTEGIKS